MRNIFSKIIILFNLFVGVFCVLMSASVMADYIDQDGTYVMEIVATPWVDSQQTTVVIPQSSGNNQYSSAGYAQAKAQEAAAIKAGKEAVYKGCKDYQTEVYRPTLAKCNVDAANLGVKVHLGCMAGAAVIGGVTYWVGGGPEVTVVAAATNNLDKLTSLGLVIAGAVFVGCGDLGTAMATKEAAYCNLVVDTTIEKICGPLKPNP